MNDGLNIDYSGNRVSMRVLVSFKLRSWPRWLWTGVFRRRRRRLKLETLFQTRLHIREMSVIRGIESCEPGILQINIPKGGAEHVLLLLLPRLFRELASF